MADVIEILKAIRETQDTTAMTADEFASMGKAVMFYAKFHDAKTAAKLVVEEYFPLCR